VELIEVEIQQALAAGGNGAVERAELAAELRIGNAARGEVAAATAAYPPLVAAVKDLADLINLRYGTNLNPTLPALEAFVEIVYTTDYTPPPSGGGIG
jgi:predicted HAD superfamily Cof-like phosphohydrolase